MRGRALQLGVLGGLCFLALPADGAGPVGVEVTGLAGTGSNPIGGAINPLLFGLGVRAGAVYKSAYAGLSYVDYFGGYLTGGSDLGAGEHAWTLGAEAGYTFGPEIVKVRPFLGVGDFVLTLGNPGAAGSIVDPASTSGATSGHVYVEPGGCVLVLVSMFVVGLDAGVLVLPNVRFGGTQESTYASAVAHLQFGLRF